MQYLLLYSIAIEKNINFYLQYFSSKCTVCNQNVRVKFIKTVEVYTSKHSFTTIQFFLGI